MNRTNFWKVLSLVLVVVGLSVATTTIMINNYNKKQDKQVAYQPEYTMPNAYARFSSATSAMETDFTVAAELSVHAVVHVKTKTKMTQMYSMDPFLEFFFGNPRSRGQEREMPMQEGAGSGVIISPDGYIVTNNHVVGNANEIEVTLNDKRTFTATIVGADPNTDIALIKIDGENLPTIPFGNSDNLKVGEWVLAVGNPFNLTSTVTAGIVSAKARNINILNAEMKIESFIQTDAAVNPGNSGGALVNTRGELVGINTAIASSTGAFTGYSFAVPSSIVSKVVSDIKEYGVVQRAILGVSISDINNELAKEKKLKTMQGAYVGSVMEKSAAENAGIKEGDVITNVNGVAVNSASELQEQVGRYRPGDIIYVEVLRDNKTKKLQVELKNRQGNTDIISPQVVAEILGAKFKEVDQKTAEKLRLNYGVQVESVSKGKFYDNGIRQGYIILKINSQTIRTPEDVQKALDQAMNNDEQEQVLFIAGAYPNGKVAHYAINLTE
ncbi:Do family serine endopeptidase [Paludibacter sp. 221]|uniref:Do family serine endopeptidase n=1 Tax=Paludibacter sp. 221 TaxID=2302939 RepID=UPI0013D7230C|nr:Do family serine endopeptidase [Paludibacter sp. 221]NDV47403.1 Do family serine endopeptidase [Paludibacter sp. 221]